MFNEYLKKVLPIPIVAIKVSKDGYKYLITTYSNVIDEYGTADVIKKRVLKNKRMKSIDGWYRVKDNPTIKQAIIEFNH